MLTTKPTCGKLFRTFMDACVTLTCLKPDFIPHGDVRTADRAIGFAMGQAEKVYLGACPAFMIRPAPDWMDWADAAMAVVCGHYGLRLLRQEGEFWGFREEHIEDVVRSLQGIEAQSTAWHATRAWLCGIPLEEVDHAYHEREGYHARCEPEGIRG